MKVKCFAYCCGHEMDHADDPNATEYDYTCAGCGGSNKIGSANRRYKDRDRRNKQAEEWKSCVARTELS